MGELLVEFSRVDSSTVLRIDDDGNLAPAATDGPGIDAALRARLQSDGTATDREGIRYRIAATVVGVLPNGNIVLEARKMIRSSDGAWEYTLTGTIASRDVRNDYTAISEVGYSEKRDLSPERSAPGSSLAVKGDGRARPMPG